MAPRNSGFKQFLSPRGQTAALVAGERTAVSLVRGVQTQGFWVELTGQLDVTVNASGVINGGDLAAAVRFFLNDNGEDTWQLDGMIATFITQCFSPSAVNGKLVPANANIQAATQLRSLCYLYAAMPSAAIPRETAYQEADPRQAFELQVELAASPVNRILNMTVGTATLTNVRARVLHEYVVNEMALPVLRPRYREMVLNVAAASPSLPLEIKTNNRLRGIVLKQESDFAGAVTDIVTDFAFRADNVDIIGPANVRFADIVRKQEMEFGGAVAGAGGTNTIVNGSMAMLNFQKGGRLASVLFPYRDALNLRFEFNCLPSVTTNAANSRIRACLLELERPAPVAGRDLVDPNLPAFLDT